MNYYSIQEQFYGKCIKKNNLLSSEIVGWPRQTFQQMRFYVLSLMADFYEKSVLDIGCGVGDFYKYLMDYDFKVAYKGVDILAEMVSLAKQKYPDGDFEQKNVEEISEKYDYVCASGTFNLRIEDNYAYLEKIIPQMFEICNKGVAFNLLKKPEGVIRDDTFFDYDPVLVYKLCEKVTPYITIRTDYLIQDFTVYLFK